MKKTTNKILLSTLISLAVIIFAGTIICIKIALNNINSDHDFYNEDDNQLTTSVTTLEEEFHAVRNNIIANVTITQGETREIKITTTEYIYNNLSIEVSGGVLEIDMAKCEVGDDYTCEIEIVTPKCTNIYNAGIGSFECSLLEGESVSIENEGVGSIYVAEVKSNNSTLYNRGVGSIECSLLEGESVTIENDAVGNIIAVNVKSKNSIISNNGVGDVTLNTMETDLLTAENDGVGCIQLAGTASKANVTNNGAGKVDISKLICNDCTISNEGAGAIVK